MIEEMETANERQEDRMDAWNSFMCVDGCCIGFGRLKTNVTEGFLSAGKNDKIKCKRAREKVHKQKKQMHIEITIMNTFSSSESMQHRKSGMERILVHGFGCCLLVVVFIFFLSPSFSHSYSKNELVETITFTEMHTRTSRVYAAFIACYSSM